MEALGLGLPPLDAFSTSSNQQSWKLLGSTHHFSPSKASLPFKLKTRNCRRVIRVQVVEEEYELKQLKDMAAARKRWDALIRDEKVKVLTPREAGYAIQLSNKALLEVRPCIEHKKAWVKGSTWIPIFDVDNKLDAGTLSQKLTSFVMGGWWSGVPMLSYDIQFLSKVEKEFPKDADLIVACQKGLS